MTGHDEDIRYVIDHGKKVDWNSVLTIAQKQNVVCVAFDGIQKCFSVENTTKEDIGMTMPMMANWIKINNSNKDRYNLHEVIFHGLVDTFEKHGIELLLLKGLGVSKLYPVPSSRTCGDIDIFPRWIDGKKLNEQGLEACEFIDKFAENKHISVEHENPKHSVFVLQNVTIENHASFMDVESIPFEREIEKTLTDYINEEGLISVTDMEYASLTQQEHSACPTMKTLSPNANYIFLLRHMAKHFRAYQSLNLRQIMDFGVFLNYYRDELDIEKIRQNIIEFKHVLINDLMVTIAEKFTGYDLGFALIEPSKVYPKDQDRIIDDIFHGKHSYSVKQNNSFLYSIIIMLRQHWKHKYIPDSFLERSLYAVKRALHIVS